MKRSFYLVSLLFFCSFLSATVVKAALPTITTQPHDSTVHAGVHAGFKIVASGTGTLTYQWQISADGGTTWDSLHNSTTYTGATTNSMNAIGYPSIDGDMYRCIVFSSGGNDTSNSATLSVIAAMPVITRDPRDTTVCSGKHVRFIIAANDTPGALVINYLWMYSVDGGSSWDTVHNSATYVGATNDTLNVYPNVLMNGYQYICIAADSSGSVTSGIATLTDIGVAPGTISGPISVCVGSAITFTDTISGGIWHSLHAAIDSVDSVSGTVYALSYGLDTLKYTDSNACGSGTARMLIKVDTAAMNAPITGPYTTCIGHSVFLMNANGSSTWATGTWSVTNGLGVISATGEFSPGLVGGIDTIIYTYTNACGPVDTLLPIQIDTVINAGTISGPSLVCEGSWIQLMESTTGGIWLSDNSTIANVDGLGNVTGINQGTATISYFISNGCGVSTATAWVQVFRTASIITGIDSVGINATRTLIDTATGGTWSSSAASVATISSAGVVTGVAVGTTTISYSVTNLCGTSTATVVMHVGKHPNAGVITPTTPDSVCIGHTITLHDTVMGGVWHSAHDSLATVDPSTGVVTGVKSGTVTISYTVSNAFGDSTIKKVIYVNHIPKDSINVPSIFALGGSYTFLGFPTGGVWSQNTDTVGEFTAPTSIPGAYVIYGDGSVTITYTVTNPCGTKDTSFVINMGNASGVNGIKVGASFLNVSPNPSTGTFTVNLLSNTTEDAIVTVTNIVGEKVKEVAISTNKPSTISLDQPEGVYLISASTANGKYTAKIVITR